LKSKEKELSIVIANEEKSFNEVVRVQLPKLKGDFATLLKQKEPNNLPHLTGWKLKNNLPRPIINSKKFDFSFAGLKTAVLYLTRDLIKHYPLSKFRVAIAHETQKAIIEGTDFYTALLDVWLGEEPADSDLKQAMLGLDE